jgi:hypothetical protein
MEKSLVKNISVDEAMRSHSCHHNRRHIISRGNKRLKVIEGRAVSHYCVECAKKFINSGIEKLNTVLGQL